jgi:ERI1 exoribonuclease 3
VTHENFRQFRHITKLRRMAQKFLTVTCLIPKVTNQNVNPRKSFQSWMIKTKTMAGIQPQKFKYLLALDFEATCDDKTVLKPQEIIEFPCLKINTKSFEVESEFHQYVKPVFNPILTGFCTELTGITQDMVEKESDFALTLNSFQSWMDKEDLKDGNFAFVTCGDWDLKTGLTSQCQTSNVSLPEWTQKWINLKKAQQKVTGKFPRSMVISLRELGLKLEGRHHSGIDDARNIAKVIKTLALKGHVFDYTSSRR